MTKEESEKLTKEQLETILIDMTNNPITYTPQGTHAVYHQIPEKFILPDQEIKKRYQLRKDPTNKKGSYGVKI